MTNKNEVVLGCGRASRNGNRDVGSQTRGFRVGRNTTISSVNGARWTYETAASFNAAVSPRGCNDFPHRASVQIKGTPSVCWP